MTCVRPSLETEPRPYVRAVQLALLVYLFLLGIHALGEGFALLGGDLLDRFFRATENPFFALVVGIVATSIVQSSSLTTSLIVGLVAAPEDPLPLANAVPMVMGANFGTTVTNTIVALGHVGRKDEFRRAFAVSTCDDFFNFFAVAILLPVEIATGFMRKTALALSAQLAGAGGPSYDSPVKLALEIAYGPLERAVHAVFANPKTAGLTLALASCALIFFALIGIVKIMRHNLQDNVERVVRRAFAQSAPAAIVMGMLATVLVQSSSIVTSLLVPLAGAGLLTLDRAYPIVLGANIGTTVTALMAAVAATGPNAGAGVAIAIVHVVFNLTGVALLYPVRFIREAPLACSRKLADVGVRSAPLAIGYVVALFYALPAALAALRDLWER